MCDHCDVLDEVLIGLAGPKVAAVIMKRVKERLHGQSQEENERARLEPETVPFK